MSTQQPGRLPDSVYRRRRVVAGLAVVAVIAIVVLIIVGLNSRGGTTPSGTPSGNPSDHASDPAGDPTTACAPSAITLTPVIDAGDFDDGVNPLISMTIENTGTTACTFNVGTDAQRYDIVSGSDPIWNSQDCQQNAQPLQQVLEPGVPLSTTPFPWDRTRSSPDTCSADRPKVTAGGATYRLSVSLGEVKSASDVPFLLN